MLGTCLLHDHMEIHALRFLTLGVATVADRDFLQRACRIRLRYWQEPSFLPVILMRDASRAQRVDSVAARTSNGVLPCAGTLQSPCAARRPLPGRWCRQGKRTRPNPASQGPACPGHPLMPHCEVCRLHNHQPGVVALEVTKTECCAIAADRLERFHRTPGRGSVPGDESPSPLSLGGCCSKPFGSLTVTRPRPASVSLSGVSGLRKPRFCEE